MGIYQNTNIILGLRILVEDPNGDYYTKYEFVGPDWKINAARILPHYIGLKNVKLQTLHPFSTSYDLTTDREQEVGNVWLDNTYFRLEDLTT